MQKMHGVAEQYLGLEVDPAIGRQHVMQVQSERRVGQAIAADRATGRQSGILPSLVRRHPVQEHVQSRGILEIVEIDPVRRHRADVDRRTHRRASLDEPVIEQIAEHRTDGADGERRTHGRPAFAPSRR